MDFTRFVLFSAAGAVLWVATALIAGLLLKSQIAQLLPRLAGIGGTVIVILLVLLCAYIAFKWWERRRFYALLDMARINVAELYQRMQGESAPVIVDVRSSTALGLERRRIPGALQLPVQEVEQHGRSLPRDREIILYCNCPNEASAAQAARLLIGQGFRQVRPLRGGLDAWIAAGYAVEEIVPAVIRQGFDGVFLDTLDNPIDLEDKNKEKFAGMSDAAAHLIHGSSEGRFRITYCPGHLSRQEIESVGYGYADLAEMRERYQPESRRDGWATLPDGERIFFMTGNGPGSLGDAFVALEASGLRLVAAHQPPDATTHREQCAMGQPKRRSGVHHWLVVDPAEIDAVVHGHDPIGRDAVGDEHLPNDIRRGNEHVDLSVLPPRECVPLEMKVDPARRDEQRQRRRVRRHLQRHGGERHAHRIVGVHDVGPDVGDHFVEWPARMHIELALRREADEAQALARAPTQLAGLVRDQYRRMPEFFEARDRQQHLVLAAAPGLSRVDVERSNHLPFAHSLANFRNT